MTTKEHNDAVIDKFMIQISNAYVDINRMISRLARKYPDHQWCTVKLRNPQEYKNHLQLWIDNSPKS